jgi:hypothetical protein
MTTAPDERPDRTTRNDRSGSLAVAPVAVWLLIQLAVLSLSAARVPLWYGAAAPVERAAVGQMLAAQVVVCALLFPWLMRNLATGACVILVSAPFVQLAATLAEVDFARAAGAWSLAALWMSALLAWSVALRASPRGRLLAVALAVALAVGGPVLRYLRSEFFPFVDPPRETTRWVDPVTAVVAQLHTGAADASPWALVAVLLVVGVLACAKSRRGAAAPSYPHN